MRALRNVALVLLTALAGGLIGGAMVRFGPGYGVDESRLDARASADAIGARERARTGERGLLRFYARYLGGLARGDFGYSQSLDRPVSQLLAERVPVSAGLVAAGVAGGWLLGIALAIPAALWRARAFDLFANLFSGLFLCLPSAVIGLLLFLFGGPIRAAAVLVVFPKVFRFARDMMVGIRSSPHVLAARSRGTSAPRLLFRHIVPALAPELLALMGISVGLAFGAVVPVEVICDLPGIGQLAWKAALGRDVPLLVAITIVLATSVQAANCASDLIGFSWVENK